MKKLECLHSGLSARSARLTRCGDHKLTISNHTRCDVNIGWAQCGPATSQTISAIGYGQSLLVNTEEVRSGPRMVISSLVDRCGNNTVLVAEHPFPSTFMVSANEIRRAELIPRFTIVAKSNANLKATNVGGLFKLADGAGTAIELKPRKVGVHLRNGEEICLNFAAGGVAKLGANNALVLSNSTDCPATGKFRVYRIVNNAVDSSGATIKFKGTSPAADTIVFKQGTKYLRKDSTG